MMISHKHKCIFIHIPKCAGTSIEVALGHFDGHAGRGGQDHRTIRMIEQPYLTFKNCSSIENLKEIMERKKYDYLTKVSNPRNKITVTQQQYESYFKFTIVRNPWARALSWYKNVILDEVHRRSYGISTAMAFKEFLVRFTGRGALRSQLYWIKQFDGSIPLDYIGRFENLAADIQTIFNRLELNNVKLPHKNQGVKDDHRKYYDSETYDLVLNHYKDEIDMFGYTFDMISAKPSKLDTFKQKNFELMTR